VDYDNYYYITLLFNYTVYNTGLCNTLIMLQFDFYQTGSLYII